jgi:23S rRNA (uracil1939-C5)-methyltransferase
MIGDEFSVRLSKTVYGGDIMGRLPDSRAVFVPFALPGELVHLRIVEEKRGHARAELLEVLEPSDLRIPAPCRHFGICGGCQYQHISYPDQIKMKAEILREQLQRIGRIKEPPVDTTRPSPEPWHYRNFVQFHLTEDGSLGYYQAGGRQIFQVEECWLAENVLEELRTQLKFDNFPEIKRVGLRAGDEDELQIILESHSLETPEVTVEDLDVSLVHISPAGRLVLAGSQAIYYRILERMFRVSAGSFFQVNTAMVEAMVKYVVEEAEPFPGMNILDVYCGVGLFSAFLAQYARKLIGIEVSTSAGEDFEYNLDDFDNVELYEASAELVLPLLNFKPDLIVVDPPRAGLGRRAIDSLLKTRADRLIYVSCDPATLARDARRLVNGGYHLIKVTPFDLFPQTYSIESISVWEY